MIQFSRPKKSLAAALDPFRRREAPASEYLSKPGEATVPPPASNPFDPTYYRTHEAAGFVPMDSQSVISQAVTNAQSKGRAGYAGYAGSVVSQATFDTASVIDQSIMGHSQYDRLADQPIDFARPRRRLSGGSLAPSDAPTASVYGFGYKAGEDDTRSVATSQAGVTDF
jgi:regulator of nonsense transcripts 1